MILPDPDDPLEIRQGVDTDLDGLPDTVLLPGLTDLTVVVDTDRDSVADLIIRIGPDGVAHTAGLGPGPLPWWPTDPTADACYDPLWPDPLWPDQL